MQKHSILRTNIEYKNNNWFCDNQKPKDCKKSTPDSFFMNGDIVYLHEDTICLGLLYPVKKGYYSFDTFDKYDNSCFIRPLDKISFYYNIKLNNIILLRKFKEIELTN